MHPMRLLGLSLVLLFFACEERVVNVPGPTQIVFVDRSALPLEYNIYARLYTDARGHYVIWWGDVKNTGLDTLRDVFTQAKIYFSPEAMSGDNFATIARGYLGVFDDVGKFTQRAIFAPGERLFHYTESDLFQIPERAQYVNYLFSFITPNNAPSSGAFLNGFIFRN